MRTAVTTVVLSLTLGVAPSVAVAATDVKRYKAWDANGDPAVNSFSEAAGDCATESFKSSRGDAWHCFAGSQILDPCFENPFFEREVLCVSSPWAREGVVVRTRLDEANRRRRPGGRPWAVVLANGKRCTFLSGGTAVGPGRHRLNYACGRSARAGFLFGTANRSHPTWTIRFAGRPDPPRYRLVKIRTAWP
jgi:hypothetical protein